MDLASLAAQRMASRIWQRDPTLFAALEPVAGPRDVVSRHLGWLDAPGTFGDRRAEIDSFVAGLAADRLTEVYLLGMGGSVLGAEVLRSLQAGAAGVRLRVVDTTDERTIRQTTEMLSPPRALFLVASKSGSTIEVTSLERHYWSVMRQAVGDQAPRHFAAITDPDTPLASHAAAQQYRHTFLNPPDIGGRYSVLSMFGLVGAALIGSPADELLASAQAMAERCRADTRDNPGLALGAFMAAAAAAGRDKLTFLMAPSLAPLAAWIEQLVAESTGKAGRGLLPVIGEPKGRVADYGPDRAFITIGTAEAPADKVTARRLDAAGHPVFHIEVALHALGGEFFRWEFATTVAAVALGVNPFDEPNVRESKVKTQELLDARRASGGFRIEPAFEKLPGLLKRVNLPARAPDAPARTHRYVALLDYLPGEPWRPDVIDRIRGRLRRRGGIATVHAIGPRYLHSSGQYHKGGANTGLFVLLTSDDSLATPIPETDYTFSMLKRAQALGDFEALAAGGRDVIHYHLENRTADVTDDLERIVVALGGPRDVTRRNRR